MFADFLFSTVVGALYVTSPQKLASCPTVAASQFSEFNGTQTVISRFFQPKKLETQESTDGTPTSLKRDRTLCRLEDSISSNKLHTTIPRPTAASVTKKPKHKLACSSIRSVSLTTAPLTNQTPCSESMVGLVAPKFTTASHVIDLCESDNDVSPRSVPLTEISNESGAVVSVASLSWSRLLSSQPIEPPICAGHREPAVRHLVTKRGSN